MKANQLILKAREAAKEMYDGPISRMDFKIHALLLQLAIALEKQMKDVDKESDE
jgi:hypothetical protein